MDEESHSSVQYDPEDAGSSDSESVEQVTPSSKVIVVRKLDGTPEKVDSMDIDGE